MNIGVVQLNNIVADTETSLAKAKSAIEKCVSDGADVVVLTELYTTGYPPRDLIYRNDLIEANLNAMKTIQDWSKEFNTTIVFGCITKNPNEGQKPFFNTAAVVSKGEMVQMRNKTLLPTYDVFSEDRYFQAGAMVDGKTNFEPVTIADQQVGIVICEEAWNDAAYWKRRLYSVDPVARMVENGAKYIIAINASPFRMGIRDLRHDMIASHCKRHRIGFCYVNQVGYNDDVGFDGNSFAMNTSGEVIFQAPPFAESVVTFATDAQPLPDVVLEYQWQHEVFLALATGIRDYFRKLGINGPAIIGMSGGIDSALVAVLAANALGKDRVIGVGMPSEFSSEGSKTDAEKLAKKLGIRFVMKSISTVHDPIRVAVDSMNYSLSATTQIKACVDSGVTDENIQARIRGVYLMALANYYNGVVLSTGNKSEIAVGYCTIYGDMCGGLAVISDLFKTKVFELCRWINDTLKEEIIPWNTINKPPSAELRANQTDQQSLPPYDVLDDILSQFVEHNKSPDEIAAPMKDYDLEMKYAERTGRNLQNDIYWVCQTVHRNEFKRKQAPTGLKLTEKMFKSGWEMPIVHKLPVHGVVKQGAEHPFEKEVDDARVRRQGSDM